MTYDIITFGSATLDIFADTFDRKHLTKEQQKMRYEHVISYHTGDKILIRDLNITVGGGGTNTALTFARFGFKTAYCGALGSDSTAAMVKAFLEENNIGFVGQTVEGNTNLSVILDSIEHDRTVLAYKESSDKLDYKRIPDLSEAKVFYSSSMMGDSYKTFVKICEFANKNDIKLAFNPSQYQAAEGYKKLSKVLTNTDYLILNKEEAQDLAMNHSPDEKVIMKILFKQLKKNSIVVVTDAANGAYAYDGETAYFVRTNNKKVVETTGAGDAFASAFIGGIMHGNSISHSLQLGAANSESVITHKGAKEIILTYDEAQKMVKKNKYKTGYL